MPATASMQQIEPAPEAMLYIAETKEEAMVEMAKLCFRPSDNSIGRSIKLTHYCDISMKYCGKLPDDWHIYVRDTKDLPLVYKDQMMKELESKHGWTDRLEEQEVHLRPAAGLLM